MDRAFRQKSGHLAGVDLEWPRSSVQQQGKVRPVKVRPVKGELLVGNVLG
jgi:hypothetical protein